MVIIKMWGGLGNQMFIHALYRAFELQGKDARIDLSYFDKMGIGTDYGYGQIIDYWLPKIFNINQKLSTEAQNMSLANIKMDPINRMIRKLGFKKKSHYIPKPEESICFISDIFKMDQVYLQGYWQSEKYFIQHYEDIKSDFKFTKPLDSANAKIASQIGNSNAVSLHIRRGDYINSPAHQKVCTLEYYRRAIDVIKQKTDSPRFYIFSDDQDWCRSNFNFIDAVYIEGNMRDDSYKDMQLMSLCKHNIIANSTFSWWGAWLNEYKNKIVIAPNQWFYGAAKSDIIPDTWIKC